VPAAVRSPVLIVSTYYPPVLGGAETAAVQLAEFLASRGRQVTVVTKRTLPNVPVEEVRNGVSVVRVPPGGNRTAWGKWLALPAITRELLRRRLQYGVVVCVDYRGVALAALLARSITGRPVILLAQTDGVLSFAAVRRLLGRVGLGGAAGFLVRPLQQLYTHADSYPCISRSIEAETRAAGVPAERVHYAPNHVDTRDFSPATAEQRAALRAKRAIPPDTRVAIVVGRLSREKGQLEALRAWKLAGVERALLLLVGPDMPGDPWDAGPEAREFVRRERLEASVVFAGGASRSEIPDFLRMADLSIQPSHFEAFGTAAIEAMAAGLPVIASDVGGLKDFVEPGVNGMRVPPRDPDSLARAIAALLNDEAQRSALAVGARRTALRFDTETVLGEFERLIDQVAIPGPGRPDPYFDAKT
jgi:glycosyltransferase involved in cell wall biosynthesis